jgi:hypothetical protein
MILHAKDPTHRFGPAYPGETVMAISVCHGSGRLTVFINRNIKTG